MADLHRVRIEPDVLDLAHRSATVNGRSLPAEINYALRHHYLRQAGIIPKEMQFGPNPFRLGRTTKKRKAKR